jgi:signal transduction histidine kinase/ActR/RegA family two-component response regulator
MALTALAAPGAQGVLRVGTYENDASVLDYVDNWGVRQGLNPSVLHAIADPRGIALAFQAVSGRDAGLSALEHDEIDLMPIACDSAPSSSSIWLSQPYATPQAGIVLSRERAAPVELSALASWRIAVANGSLGGEAAKAWLPDSRFIAAGDAPDALDAVALGRADAFVGIQDVNAGLLGALALGSLQSVPLPAAVSLCFAARNDDDAVVSLIAEGLKHLSPAMRSEMQVQPQPQPASTQRDRRAPFSLTPDEQAWVRAHPVVRVGVQRLDPPYDFLDDNGAWRGLGATLLRHFAQTAQLHFKPVPLEDGPVLADALRDGTVDLVSSFPVGNGGPADVILTRPYDSLPWVFVRPANHAARVQRVATVPWRMKRVVPVPPFNDATVVARTSSADALRAVLAGNADAALVNLVAAQDLGDRYMSRRLSVDTSIAGIERNGFAVAARDDVLAQMLDRYLASYGPRELARLASRSRPVSVVLGYDKRSVIAVALSIAAVVATVLGSLLWAYRRTRAAQCAAVAARREAVAAREEAEAADRAKSAFVAMISHEIRTPMNGVVGVIDLLGALPATPQQRRYLDVADASAKLMLRVVDDTLDFLKIEQGALSLQPVPFDFYALCANVVELFAPLAQRKGLPLYSAVMPHFDRIVVADEARVHQIMTNLLSNAIRFTSEGHVLIEARLRVGREGTSLELVVADTGIGMTQDYQRRMFTPFTQQDGSTTRRVGGTGLGLSIVKRVVDLMKGTIDVASEPGRGTRVRVSVPVTLGTPCRDRRRTAAARVRIRMPLKAMTIATLALARKLNGTRVRVPADTADLDISVDGSGAFVVATQSGPPTTVRSVDALAHAFGRRDPASGVGGEPGIACEGREADRGLPRADAPTFGAQVLLVEDNDINRDIIAHQLASLGVHAHQAVNGVDGYACWQRLRPNLMLLDCHMPGMDGYTVARRVRASEASTGKRTTIVAISANGTRDDIAACLDAGMDDYLAKPITRAKLAATLAKWMERKNEIV